MQSIRFILLVSLFYGNVQAQYHFEKLTTYHGLSNNHITCFLKDSTGFLWIGTKNGLNRYDGASFKTFKPSSQNSISNEVINDIAQDKTGKLWIATMDGLNIYDPIADKWETIMPDGTSTGIPSYLIHDLCTDEEGRIWIVSDVWRLSRYDPSTKTFNYFNWPAFKQQPVFNGMPIYRTILKIKPRNKSEYWLATNIGLCSVNSVTGQFRLHGICRDEIRDIQYDRERGTVFMTGKSDVLYCYDEQQDVFTTIQPERQPHPAVQWVKDHKLPAKLLMAHPDGILEIDRKTKKAIIIPHQPLLPSSLQPGQVTALYKDNTGIVWAGTNQGIGKYNSRLCVAQFIPLSTAPTDDRKGDMGAALYDPVEKSYFVTSPAARQLHIIDSNGRIRLVTTGSSPATNICTDQHNNIWLLTETSVFTYDRTKQRLIEFPTPNNRQPVIFRDMIEDKNGDYWFCTWQDGLYHYQTANRQFHKMRDADGFWSVKTTALYNDPKENALWVGTFEHGVYRYDLDSKKFTLYGENEANPDYMQLNLIYDIAADTCGHLWFTTFGAGLYKYEHGKAFENSFTRVTHKNGLPASTYGSIASDGKGRLWLLDNEGLSVFSNEGQFLYRTPPHPAISFNEYLPDRPYSKNIFYNKWNDEILVPVAGGLLLYYPGKKTEAAPFRVVITDKGEDDGSRHFKFAALTYANHPIQYEYKLHKNDKEWKQLGNNGTASFPDLAPGQHHFMVRAKDAAGNYSENIASYSFYIQPPFWKTSWFIGLVLLSIGYMVYRWVHHLQRKVKAQQTLKYFATSLYGQNTVEDVFWDIAKNCTGRLQLIDCVIYLYDPQRKVLLQKAAYGPKNPEKHEIANPMEIPLGQGIVGTVAQTLQPEIIRNTAKDSRYIVDDERRYSEITVPIIVDNELFGVIDSEHPKKNYFSKYHLRILQEVAAICSDKISKYIIQERLQAKISRDLHDEIGSALTSINVLSKVALSKARQESEISNYLFRIKNSATETMNNMSDIVWAINPKNNKLEDISSRMKEFVADICEGQGIALEFSISEELGQLPLDLSRRKNIFLIFKEAVNNAVKYSACNMLKIGFEQKAGTLQLVIQDDGKGFNSASITHGNGLNNMNYRAVECGGRLFMETMINKGTRVVFEMPLPKLGGLPVNKKS